MQFGDHLRAYAVPLRALFRMSHEQPHPFYLGVLPPEVGIDAFLRA